MGKVFPVKTENVYNVVELVDVFRVSV